MATATKNGNGAAAGVMGVGLDVPRMERRMIEVTLVGDSELICHRWSDKAKQMMLDKQMKKASKGKEAKDPWQDFCDSLYWMTKQPEKATPEDIEAAEFGMPAVAFKAAAVGACRFADMKMTEARGAFHVENEMIKIDSNEPPRMREDMVRISMGTADIRYRGGFPQWSVTLPVVYNATAISPEQIVNLFNIAGFGIGIGEWRPEKDGQFGRFHVIEGASS